MTAPLITVLITTHNYGRFIEQAIDSVLSQEFPLDGLQISVVDDGSTDNTAERVKRYGTRVEYFYKPNGGQASALNLGIARARGEIIALLDADDFFLPGKLARVAEAFQKDPTLGLAYHPYEEWYVETNERRQSSLPLISGDTRVTPDQFVSYIPYATSCIALRRALLGPLLPIPEAIRMLADCYLVQLIPLLSPILAIPEPLVVYRIHGENHYYADGPQMPLEVRKSRLQKLGVLFDAMREWLANNELAWRQPAARFFRDRWYLYQQAEEFVICPPSRLRFFWFLLRENYAHCPIQTWRLTALNYATALSALVLGYANWRQVGEWRSRVVVKAETLFRRFFRTHSAASFRGGAKF